MGHLRETFHIDAPLDVCWDIGTDAGRQPEWAECVLEVKDVTGRLAMPERLTPASSRSPVATSKPGLKSSGLNRFTSWR